MSIVGPRASGKTTATATSTSITTTTTTTTAARHARDVVNLHRYLEACALLTGGVVDQMSIARDAGVDRRTGAGYDDLLQRLMLIDSTPAWTTNRLERLIRTPKRSLVDASLLNGLFGVTPEAVLRARKDAGPCDRNLRDVTTPCRAGAGAAPTASDARHLAWLRDELGERFLATPISALWS